MIETPFLLMAAYLPDRVWWEYVTRNWALVSMLITVAFLLVTCWLILRKYVRIMLNIIRDTPPPLAMGPRDFERINGERVTFRAFDNLNLCGMFLFGDHGGEAQSPHQDAANRPAGSRAHTALQRGTVPISPGCAPVSHSAGTGTDALSGRNGDGPRACQTPSKGMVIFAHEFSSDMYSCARYCQPLLAAGYDVFSFDFRGHGESSGEPGYQPRQWPSDREVNDMLGALAYLEDWLERRGRPVEIGLFGISRGAGAAIIAAQDNPAVKAIITDGAFSSDTTLEHLMKRWAYIFAKVRFVYENHPPQFWRFLRWLLFRACKRKLNCTFPSTRKALMRMSGSKAILFIHGERDSYIPVEQSQLLYKLAPGPKSLWIVPGAKHNQSVVVRPEYYAARTVAFFDEHLARPAVVGGVTEPASGEPASGTRVKETSVPSRFL